MPKRSNAERTEPATVTRDKATGAVKVRGQFYSLGEISRGAKVSRPHITRIFSGKRGLSLTAAQKIAGFLGVSIESLLQLLNRRPTAGWGASKE